MPSKLTQKILLLDDDSFMLSLNEHFLNELGFHNIVSFDNGLNALSWMDSSEEIVYLILLDLNMPNIDGIEFMRRLVDRKYCGALILVSGEDENLLQSAEKLAIQHKLMTLGHLQKPINLQSIGELINKWEAPTKTSIIKSKQYSPEEIRIAIEQEQLVNFYQPKVNIKTLKVTGVESLVRWNHPTDGMVYPDQFISVSEEFGLINDLTKLVAKNAISQLKKWHDNDIHLRVAINLSMDDLASLDFVDFMLKQIDISQVNAKNIVLEVTESRLTYNFKIPLEILTRLRLHRFNLSIDDFGTGHSSLTQLRDFPFNELKIDGSFVHCAGSNPKICAIFDACHNLGKQLNMVIVAEGVENREDWDFLRASQCDLAQGYFIAKPMPAEQIETWLIEWSARAKLLFSSTPNYQESLNFDG